MSLLRLRFARADERATLPPALQTAAAPDPGLDADDSGLLLLDTVHPDGAAGASSRATSRATSRTIGCVRLRPGIGLRQPRYWYHVGLAVRAAGELGLFHRDRVLALGNDLTGAIELAGFALDDVGFDETTINETAFDGIAAPHDAAWRALVTGAVWLAQRRHGADAAAARLIVELPGVRVGGRSPFWDGLGRHFYSGEPDAAARAHGALWRSHVAALLPQHPLVASLLAADAQAAIGAVPGPAQALCDALLAAGLRLGEHVTLDEAGAVCEGELARLPAVRDARTFELRAGELDGTGARWMIAGDAAVGFVPAHRDGGALVVAETAIAALGLASGARVDALAA